MTHNTQSSATNQSQSGANDLQQRVHKKVLEWRAEASYLEQIAQRTQPTHEEGLRAACQAATLRQCADALERLLEAAQRAGG